MRAAEALTVALAAYLAGLGTACLAQWLRRRSTRHLGGGTSTIGWCRRCRWFHRSWHPHLNGG